MKKILEKIKGFFQRKGYEPPPHTDTIWAQAKESNVESGTNSFAPNSVTLPNDVIEEMKKAKQEVEEFEKTLQSFKQKTTT